MDMNFILENTGWQEGEEGCEEIRPRKSICRVAEGASAKGVVDCMMVFGIEITKISQKLSSGGEKRWKPTEITFDLWPL